MPVLTQYITTNKRSMITCNMGNFPPNSRATLTCFMTAQLENDCDRFSLRLPLTFIQPFTAKKEEAPKDMLSQGKQKIGDLIKNVQNVLE